MPGEYSVSVRVAGHEEGLVVSVAGTPPEGRTRRKAEVTRLIHCRVENIVLRSRRVAGMMVVLSTFSFSISSPVSAFYAGVSIANQYEPA